MAVQGGLAVANENGSNVGFSESKPAGWGPFGGASMERHLIGGFKTPLSDIATLDIGPTGYMYPGGTAKTRSAEPYLKPTGTGADAAAGVYHEPGARADSLYLWRDAAAAVAGAPIPVKAHMGHSRGQDERGPNATAAAPAGEYRDRPPGADASWTNLNCNVSSVDTDSAGSDASYLRPSFTKGEDATGITAVVSLAAAL